jgi:hypothetical protein
MLNEKARLGLQRWARGVGVGQPIEMAAGSIWRQGVICDYN